MSGKPSGSDRAQSVCDRSSALYRGRILVHGWHTNARGIDQFIFLYLALNCELLEGRNYDCSIMAFQYIAQSQNYSSHLIFHCAKKFKKVEKSKDNSYTLAEMLNSKIKLETVVERQCYHFLA